MHSGRVKIPKERQAAILSRELLYGRDPYAGMTFATFDWTAARYILDEKLVPETLANDSLTVLDRPAVQISAAQRFKKVM